MSLFAVGGANAAIPEMHRIAVEVRHWMTDREFADIYAISQLSPGPNVLIVTLIGYSVAGLGGALAATLAMCVPTAALAYVVSRWLTRSRQSRWPCPDPGIVGAAVDRIDGGERADRSAGRRSDLGRRALRLSQPRCSPPRPGSTRSGFSWSGAFWVLLALSDESR